MLVYAVLGLAAWQGVLGAITCTMKGDDIGWLKWVFTALCLLTCAALIAYGVSL